MIDIAVKNNKVIASDTVIYKAINLLSTQIGSLAYAPEFGIDYDLFFLSDYKIQIETFKAYAISKLVENSINPIEVLTEENSLETLLNFKISD